MIHLLKKEYSKYIISIILGITTTNRNTAYTVCLEQTIEYVVGNKVSFSSKIDSFYGFSILLLVCNWGKFAKMREQKCAGQFISKCQEN